MHFDSRGAADLGQKLRRAALRNHVPFVEKHNPSGQLLGQCRVVGGGEHAHAVPRAYLEYSKESCPRRWIQAERGFVHYEHVGVVNQSLRDEKLFLHAIRVTPSWGRAAHRLGQVT